MVNCDTDNSNQPDINNIMQQLLEQANSIQPVDSDSNNTPFWSFFRNIVQFMVQMMGQFMRLFTSLPMLGKQSDNLLGAKQDQDLLSEQVAQLENELIRKDHEQKVREARDLSHQHTKVDEPKITKQETIGLTNDDLQKALKDYARSGKGLLFWNNLYKYENKFITIHKKKI